MKARETVEESYSWEIITHEVEEIYLRCYDSYFLFNNFNIEQINLNFNKLH